MDKVIEAVERIGRLPETITDCEVYVDIGIAQGREAFLKQLEEHSGKDEADFVDRFMTGCQKAIGELKKRVSPHILSQDYIFFLEYYGGIAMEDRTYNLSTFGIGSMEEIWYFSILNTDEIFLEVESDGFLTIGDIGFRTGIHKYKHIAFFLDLGGTIQKNCVIGVGPWEEDTANPVEVLKNLETHPTMWRNVANSFTEWLQLAAETNGGFGYK